MIGLIYLAVALYIALGLYSAARAWKAVRPKASIGTSAVVSVGTFLIFYLPVFWNHIPLLLEHRRLCANDGGLRTYMTAQEWVNRNKRDLDELGAEDLMKEYVESKSKDSGFSRYMFLGGMVAHETHGSNIEVYGVNVYKFQSRLIDVKSDEIIHEGVDYSSGSRTSLIFWLYLPRCPGVSRGGLVESRFEFERKVKEIIR